MKQQSLHIDKDTVRQEIERLRDLPCLFPVVSKAIEATQDPNSTNRYLESILTADQGVAARVLRLANSAYFGVQTQVSTISVAVGLIGMVHLRMMLRAIMIAEIFDLLSAKSPAAHPIWRVAVASGAGCHRTSQACGVGDPEEMLTLGLLHNVGELALLSQFREEFLAARENGRAKATAEAERAVFGVESGEVGRWLMDAWSFPSIYGKACAFWREPCSKSVEESLQRPLAAVHVGASLAHATVEGREQETITSLIAPVIRATLGLELQMITEIYDSLEEDFERVRRLLTMD